jgi:phage terminase small subunit
MATRGALIRYDAFAREFVANDGHATNAALAAGYSEKTAYSQGSRLSKNAEVLSMIAVYREKMAKKANLTVERTLQEVARIGYFDPRKLYDDKGNLIPVHLLDDDTAAAIASVERDEIGTAGNVIGYTTKVKHWDKNSALDKAMKHLGLYERDNAQRPAAPANVQITVIAVRAAG